MFHNLIESGSHVREIKRRGSFFAGAFVFYMGLLAVAGVVSIYAYNAQLDDRNLDLEVTLMRFPPVQTPDRAPEPRTAAQPSAARAGRPQMVQRTEISIQNPNLAGRQVARAETPEVTPRVPVMLGDRNFTPGTISLPTDGNAHGDGNNAGTPAGGPPRILTPVDEEVPERVVKRETPPPAPPAPPKKIVVTSTVLSSKVISKPSPPYPKIARDAHAQGPVSVQILVDEQGRVISAQATSGHPLLRQAAAQAALQARFTPTILNGQPVKISGIITYNFVLQ